MDPQKGETARQLPCQFLLLKSQAGPLRHLGPPLDPWPPSRLHGPPPRVPLPLPPLDPWPPHPLLLHPHPPSSGFTQLPLPAGNLLLGYCWSGSGRRAAGVWHTWRHCAGSPRACLQGPRLQHHACFARAQCPTRAASLCIYLHGHRDTNVH